MNKLWDKFQEWEKKNNPFYPSEMRWDRHQAFEAIKSLMGNENPFTTHEMIDCVIQRERGNWDNRIETYTNLINASEVFCNKHFGEIKKINNEIKTRGMSAEFEFNGKKFSFLTYEIVGRLMMTIKHNPLDPTEIEKITETISKNEDINVKHEALDEYKSNDFFISFLGASGMDEKSNAGLHAIYWKNDLISPIQLIYHLTDKFYSIKKNLKESESVSI